MFLTFEFVQTRTIIAGKLSHIKNGYKGVVEIKQTWVGCYSRKPVLFSGFTGRPGSCVGGNAGMSLN